MKATRLAGYVLVILAASSGCTDNRQSFFIRFIGEISEECSVSPDRNAPYKTSGLIDMGNRSTYILTPIIENAMSTSTSLNPITAEANRVTVTGAQVRLSTETGERLGGGDFFVPLSTTIDPGGVASMDFVAIPNGYLAGVADGQMVIVETKILGITGGGLEIDTPWFSFPVYTCVGCLSKVPSEATWNAAAGCYDCSAVTTTSTENPCALGQDDFYVDCCAYSTPDCDALVCP